MGTAVLSLWILTIIAHMVSSYQVTQTSLLQECAKNCKVAGNICDIPDRRSCRHFITCLRYNDKPYHVAFRRPCGLNQMFVNETNSCQPKDISNLGYCEDMCQDNSLDYYQIDCAQYYECNNNVSEPKCCPEGQAFSNGACKANSSCVWNCPLLYRPEVIMENITSDENGTTTPEPVTVSTSAVPCVRDCAPGSILNKTRCECDLITNPENDASTRKCLPEFIVQYPMGITKWPIHRAYSSAKVTIQDENGKFSSKDHSSSFIPFYLNNNKLLKMFNITVIFLPQGTGNETQNLVSNCNSYDKRDRPSMGIQVRNIQQEILFIADDTRTENKEDSVRMRIRYNVGKWIHVTYLFDGKTLTAIVSEMDTAVDTNKTHVQTETFTFQGPVTLRTSPNPITIGYCSLPDGYYRAGFDGLIRTVHISPRLCENGDPLIS